MPDLQIDGDRLATAASRLRSAGAAVGGVCAATGACGSSSVEAALGEVELIVRGALDALASTASQLSSDVDAAAAAFDDADADLAGKGAR